MSRPQYDVQFCACRLRASPGARNVYCRVKESRVTYWKQILESKVHPRTSQKSLEGEYRYNSTLSLPSALDRGGWSAPRPGRFTPGKVTLYPFYRSLGEHQGRPGQVRKISPRPGFDPRTVQPVANRYTTYYPGYKVIRKFYHEAVNMNPKLF